MDNSSKLFEYSNQYFKNGNVKSMEISGDYSKNFATPSDLAFEYEYDRSNRLTKATIGENIFEVINTYDKDGNILSLERHGSTGIRIEAFNYIYYSGTNKLQQVSGGGTQYTYDANGNMISDALNKNVNIEYDHRNLIIELEHTKYILNDSLIILTKYYYDEAGNRIRKMTYDTEDDSLKSDIVYSRDVSGKELAVYENGSIKQWNLFGLDNIGYMTESDELRFYLKDHLGSVRVVTDNQSAVINCQDYDPWGYVLENRIYQSDESVYKFTSKERDEESEYDYFGARYYDARIANWGTIDPLMEKHYDFSPYNYVLRNPLRLIDPDGAQTGFSDLFYNIYSESIIGRIEGDYYMSLGAVNRERYTRSKPDYNRGSIISAEMQPADLIGASIGISLAKKFPIFSRTVFVVEENIGTASNIGLEWVDKSVANPKTAEKLGFELKEFMGNVDYIKYDPEISERLTVGNLKKTGKEIRFDPPDKTHNFIHIDIERNATGKIYKDLKLKIHTEYWLK